MHANNHLVILFTPGRVNRQHIPQQLMHAHLHLHPTIHPPKPLRLLGNNSQWFSYLCDVNQTTTLLPRRLSPQLAEIMKEAACETFKC